MSHTPSRAETPERAGGPEGAWELAIEVSNPASASAPGTEGPWGLVLPAGGDVPGVAGPGVAGLGLGGPGVAGRRLMAGGGAGGQPGAESGGETGGLSGPGAIWVEPIRAGVRQEEDLMPAIDRLARGLGVGPVGLRRVVVSVGPGGYTGLRVAVTTAKMLGLATGAELIGVPSACVAAAGAGAGDGLGDGLEAEPVWPMLVALNAKQGTVHATLFRSPKDCGEVLGVVNEGVFAAHLPKLLVADHHLPAQFCVEALSRPVRIVRPMYHAALLLELGRGFNPCLGEALRPVYAREPEAVRLWRERLG